MENHSWRSREFCATCDLLAVESDCNRDHDPYNAPVNSKF